MKFKGLDFEIEILQGFGMKKKSYRCTRVSTLIKDLINGEFRKTEKQKMWGANLMG